jgi:hypothetical protein
MKIAYDQDGVMHVVLAHLHQMPGVLLFFLTIILNLIFLKRKETNGNYLVLDINVDKINFTLVSIYGPNEDNPQFYENIMSIVEEFGNENFIICGDFNLVLCPELDYCNYPVFACK